MVLRRYFLFIFSSKENICYFKHKNYFLFLNCTKNTCYSCTNIYMYNKTSKPVSKEIIKISTYFDNFIYYMSMETISWSFGIGTEENLDIDYIANYLCPNFIL